MRRTAFVVSALFVFLFVQACGLTGIFFAKKPATPTANLLGTQHVLETQVADMAADQTKAAADLQAAAETLAVPAVT